MIEQKRRLHALLQEKRKRQCEGSLHEFVRDAFPVIHNGDNLVDNSHVQYICGKLQQAIERVGRGEARDRHILINVPPRSLKSEMIICMTVWAWITWARLKFISSSYSKDLSIDHNVMARRLIESDWYQERWGDRFEITSDQNTKSKFDNTEDGSRTCTSNGGTIMGKGGHVIIVDDATNAKQSVSEKKRKEANDHFDLTLRTRLDDPETGLYIVVMQRLHEMDLTGHLLKKEPTKWLHICIPAELTDDVRPKTLRNKYTGGLFFPKRFSKSFLDDMAVGLGSYGYACQYLQRAAPEAGGIIKKAWFGRFNLLELDKVADEKNVPVVWNYFVDGAYTAKEQNDPTVILCAAYVKPKLYIRARAKVWLELPELVKFIPEFCLRTGYNAGSLIRIEPKGPGLDAAHALQRWTDLNVLVDKAPTVDKVSRAKSITPFLEAKRCDLLEGEEWIDDYLGELGGFPNTAHDDQVDTTVMAVNNVEEPTGSIIAWG